MEQKASDPVVLRGRQFNLADYVHARYAPDGVPAGTTLEDVLNPAYFRNFLHLIKPGTQIDVLSDDYALDVSLRVLTVGKTEARCRLMRDNNPPKASSAAGDDVPSGYTVSFGGPHHKWRVVRDGVDEPVAKNFGSKEEAVAAAKEIAAA